MSKTPGEFMRLKPLRYNDQNENIKKYILIGSTILGIAAMFLISELRSPVIQTDRYSAYSAAQKFVRETLKETGTADFQSVNRAEITDRGDNTWEINSYVDFNETPGKPVRSFFNIKIQYDGDEWILKHLNFNRSTD